MIATFTASQNLGDVAIRVVPELEPFLTVDPTSLSNVRRGEEVELVLSIAAPENTPLGLQDGTIQLHNARGGTYAQPLPVGISILEPASFTPPDPGEAGKLTLEGIDADGDGLRDDVERYILETYPDLLDSRDVLDFDARSRQQLITQDIDPALGRILLLDEVQAHTCLSDLHGSRTATLLIDDLRAQMLNTPARSSAYLRATVLPLRFLA